MVIPCHETLGEVLEVCEENIITSKRDTTGSVFPYSWAHLRI